MRHPANIAMALPYQTSDFDSKAFGTSGRFRGARSIEAEEGVRHYDSVTIILFYELKGTQMIRIAICDDDPSIRTIAYEQVQIIFRQIAIPNSVSQFSNGNDLLASCMNRSIFDLYLLDIEMPGLNGLETARIVRQANADAVIIFLTSYEQHARAGYSVKAHRFVLKSCMETELKEALTSAIPLTRDQPGRVLFLTDKNEKLQIPIHDIVFFEVVNRKIIVHTANESYKSRERLPFAEFCALFAAANFSLCYRGIMVNLDAVWSLQNDAITLTNNQKLPVSRQYLSPLTRLIADRSRGET